MYIEDILTLLLKSYIKINPYDLSVLRSLDDQYSAGNLYTQKQADMLIRILKKYNSLLQTLIPNIDVSSLEFKSTFRSIDKTKKMSIVLSDKDFTKFIKIKFPFNTEIIKELKDLHQSGLSSMYEIIDRSWMCPLTENNIIKLISVIDKFQFEVDEELSQYIAQIKVIQENFEKYIPSLLLTDNTYKIVNLPSQVEIPEMNTLENALFTARKFGVTVWDSNVETQLLNQFDPITIRFLKNNPKELFHLTDENSSINDLQTIIKNLLPCLVILPQNNELNTLKNTVEFFNKIEIPAKNMSVMFRLSNSTDSDFNEYVKNNNLNSPLSNETQAVFISQELPKTLVKSNKKFNSILLKSTAPVSSKLSRLTRYHENVIVLNQGRIQFAFM